MDLKLVVFKRDACFVCSSDYVVMREDAVVIFLQNKQGFNQQRTVCVHVYNKLKYCASGR